MKKIMYGMLLIALGICTAGGYGGISGKSGPQSSGGTEETEVITEEMVLAGHKNFWFAENVILQEKGKIENQEAIRWI